MKKYPKSLVFQNDTGAALVTVLLLVSVMAVGAAVTFEALGFSIKRASAQRQYDQAGYYAMGGEKLALSAAESLSSSGAVLLEPRAVSFEIEGGRIDGIIADASNCFNVNSLVQRRDIGTYVVTNSAALTYRRLMVALGFSDRQSEQLSAALVDWIDTDTRPLPSGAEDYDYAALDRPYRTANALIADMSELHLITGYTPDIMALLNPLLCNLDTTASSVLNVNTLTVDHVPLLVALIGGNFTVEDAVELILSRPRKGYDNIADFWLEPSLESLSVEQSTRKQTSIKGRRFVSRVRVQYFDATSYLTSVIQVDDADVSRLVSHQRGVLP